MVKMSGMADICNNYNNFRQMTGTKLPFDWCRRHFLNLIKKYLLQGKIKRKFVIKGKNN